MWFYKAEGLGGNLFLLDSVTSDSTTLCFTPSRAHLVVDLFGKISDHPRVVSELASFLRCSS